MEVLKLEHADDVLDVGVQPDAGPEQMRPLAQTGERWRVHVVAKPPQP